MINKKNISIITYIPVLLASLVFTLTISLFLSHDTVQAWSPSDCGVINDGNQHAYGGMVVRLYVQVDGGPVQAMPGWRVADMDVNVTTVGRTASPPGNVVFLGGGPEGVSERLHDRSFRPNQGGACDGMVVLKGTPGHWAIDCDVSKNGDFQQIGANAANGQYIPLGYRDLSVFRQGSWDVENGGVQRVPNGGSAVFKLIYKTSTSINAKAHAFWSTTGQTSVIDNKVLVRRGEPVNFLHSFQLNMNYQPQPTEVNKPTSCTRTSCPIQWSRYDQYLEDLNAANQVNFNAEVTARNKNDRHPFWMGKNWVIWDRNKQIKMFGYWGATPIVSYGLGSDRAVPYQASVVSNEFNSSRVQSLLAAGDSYCEYSFISMQNYQATYNDGTVSEQGGESTTSPAVCVFIRSEFSTVNGGNQNIERIDGNGRADRGLGEVAGTAQTGAGDYTYPDAWVKERYRINGWLVNQGPEFSDEPITLHARVEDNILGQVFDPYGSVTTGYNIPPNTEMARLNYDIINGGATIPSDAGGKTVCQQTFWNSAFGDPNPNFNGNTYNACVYVPYFYHITNLTVLPTSSSGSSVLQQGDSIKVTAGASLLTQYNNGRYHTNSENLSWRLNQCVTKPGPTESCNDVRTGAYTFTPQTNIQNLLNDVEVLTPTDTAKLPIGTKVCYTLTISKGSHDGGEIQSPAGSACYIITKTPKVQFGNSDVLTGRGIPANADDTNCTSNNSAKIATKGIPDYVWNNPGYSNKNLYGAWGEYGVFATGSISGFGSAAYAEPDANVKKMLFANTVPTGSFRGYDAPNCTYNWFAKMTDSSSTTTDNTLRITDTSTTAGKNLKRVNNNIEVKADSVSTPASYNGTKILVRALQDKYNDEDAILEIKTTYSVSGGAEKTLTIKRPFFQTYPRNGSLPSNWGTAVLDINLFDPSANNKPVVVKSVSAKFDNDAFSRTIGFADRNMYIKEIVLESGSASRTINLSRAETGFPPSSGHTSTKNGVTFTGIAETGNCIMSFVDPTNPFLWSATSDPKGEIIKLWGDGEPTTGFCSGIITKNINFSNSVIPSTSILGTLPASSTPTVIYAQSNKCDGSNGGTIRINSDIKYNDSTPSIYSTPKDVPRVILMADCGIIIDKDVQHVDATLVTRGAVSTCSGYGTGAPFADTIFYADSDGKYSNNYKLTKGDCSKPLTVTGTVVAKKIHFLRTYGADLSDSAASGFSGDPTIPAENFTQNPVSLITAYQQSLQNEGRLIPEEEKELPPIY